MSEVCYLCGKVMLASQETSEDHVVPATLIKRSQPKVSGFDYGSRILTHRDCNSRFGPETYVSKALDLLGVLFSDDAWQPLQHVVNADITLLPLNAEKLAHFTKRDLAFFKLIDARRMNVSALSDPRTFSELKKSNPKKDALVVALSVLAKSAAALLVKRHLRKVPQYWRIYANPYIGSLRNFDLAGLVGDTKPFDHDLRIWVIELPNNNWHVVYAAQDVLVFFTFVFADRVRALRELMSVHSDADTLGFCGAAINELLAVGWREI